jgi:hypothetical protein
MMQPAKMHMVANMGWAGAPLSASYALTEFTDFYLPACLSAVCLLYACSSPPPPNVLAAVIRLLSFFLPCET